MQKRIKDMAYYKFTKEEEDEILSKAAKLNRSISEQFAAWIDVTYPDIALILIDMKVKRYEAHAEAEKHDKDYLFMAKSNAIELSLSLAEVDRLEEERDGLRAALKQSHDEIRQLREKVKQLNGILSVK